MDNAAELLPDKAETVRVPKRRRKVTVVDHVLVMRLADNDPKLSFRQIGKQLNLDDRSVSRILRLREIKPADILKAGAGKAAQAWIRAIGPAAAKGDHRAARDLLLHTRSIEPIKADNTPGITIVFGTGLLPGCESHNSRELVVDIPKQLEQRESERD